MPTRTYVAWLVDWLLFPAEIKDPIHWMKIPIPSTLPLANI